MGTRVVAAITFLTPAGALVSLAALLPLLAAWRGALRARHVRASLELTPAPHPVDTSVYAALAAVILLLGLGAAQPALSRESTQRVRSDAQALFVLDVSRSMAAAARPGSPTRLERAKAAARQLRASIPEIESGLATLTDRVLPDLLPVADIGSFDDTLARSVLIEEPPPRATRVRATTYAALGDVPAGNYFAPATRRRVLVLLTDGETQPIDDPEVARSLAAEPGISLVLVRFWNGDESIYDATGKADAAYRPDPTGSIALDSLASATHSRVFDERSLGAATDYVGGLLGTGPTRPTAVRQRDEILLGPYLAALALVPLGVLAVRRKRRSKALAEAVEGLV